MPTARTIINDAMRRIGATATGEVPTGAEASDALTILNDMLESWSLQSMLVLDETITTKVLTASTQSYTVGSGGDINITWPLQIDQAQLRVTSSSPNLDIPLYIMNAEQYGHIRLKTETSTYPQSVYLNTAFPLATLYLWPVPTDANTLVLWTKGVVTSFATLDTNANLARGYARALRYNLAVELAPEMGREVSAELSFFAQESKELIKRSNSKPAYAYIDVPAGAGYGGGAYNWQDDRGA